MESTSCQKPILRRGTLATTATWTAPTEVSATTKQANAAVFQEVTVIIVLSLLAQGFIKTPTMHPTRNTHHLTLTTVAPLSRSIWEPTTSSPQKATRYITRSNKEIIQYLQFNRLTC